MLFSLFNTMGYEAPGLPYGWPTPAKHWQPELARESMARNWELCDVAVEHGFDWLTVAEHHYSPGQLAPNPVVMATAISQRYPETTAAVLGVVLPLANPVRVAEELAILDTVADGRTVVGFFRGIPNEYLTYGTNPAESRAMYEEGIELIMAAWTEPEPFGWEGRYYQFRTVSVWPRPLQQPTPPIVLAGTSPYSAQFAARKRAKLALSFLNTVDAAAELAELYRTTAAEEGWEPTPEDIVFRARVYVAETDEQAQEEARRYDLGNVLGRMVPPPERMAANQKILGAAFGPSGFRHHPPGPGSLPEYLGGPDTVARQVREASERIGYGVCDFIFTGHLLPHEKALRSLELFGAEVVPQLREAGVAAA